jgi:hypothetical protein
MWLWQGIKDFLTTLPVQGFVHIANKNDKIPTGAKDFMILEKNQTVTEPNDHIINYFWLLSI